MSFEKIPQEIKDMALCCLWKYEDRNGKRTKPPYNHRTGRYARSDDPATFGPYDDVLAAYKHGGYEGIGMGIFDVWCAVDIDHCFAESRLSSLGIDIVDTMHSYTEVSPSGEGIRIIFKAQGFTFDKDAYYTNNKKLGLEIYVAGCTKKYVTLTGQVMQNWPIEDKSAEIAKVMDKYMKKPKHDPKPKPKADHAADAEYLKRGLERDEKLKAYWEGTRPQGNESSDDQGFVDKLAYWCNGNAAMMEQAFFDSPHYQQKDSAHKRKCDRKDYLPGTIAEALADLKSTAREDDEDYQQHQVSQDFSPQEKDKAPNDVEPFETITAIELSKKDLPPVKWVVKDLLPQGEALLVAPSKYGKGWFAIDLSLSVAGGWPFLGFEVVQTEVLYLALEDSYRRLKSRQQLILGFDEAPIGLTFAIRAKTIDNGLANQIDAHMAQNPNTGLIIIDVLQKVRSTRVQRGMGAYALDYNDMTQIKAMADKYDITILCVHHDRKMKDSEDPFNQISGTNAIMGSADTIMLITKKARNDGRAVLMVTGRDVESQDYVMELDLKKTYRWHRVATVEEEEYNQELEEYNSEPVVKTIKGLLAMSPGGIELTASEIQNHMLTYADTMMSDKAIGKAITRLKPNLYNHDKIRHLFERNGNKRKHRFFKPGYVFPFEMPETEGETS